MKKFALNSVKWVLLISLWGVAFGEVPFSVTAPPQVAKPTTKEGQSEAPDDAGWVGDLKRQAVAQWLQGYLGSRYPQFEKLVTADLAERYILDYRLGRSGANKELIELSGHLDHDSLKKWVRLMESKGRGGNTQVKPVLFLSSDVAGLSLSPSQTSSSVTQSVLGQEVFSLLSQEFAHWNAKVAPNSANIPFSHAPSTERDLAVLRDSNKDGSNLGIWAHLGRCASCDNPRLDLFILSFSNLRVVSVISEDFTIPKEEWSSRDRVKAGVSAAFQQFHTALESALSEGKCYSQNVALIVEGMESYRVFRALDGVLSKQDFILEPVLKSVSGKVAEYEMLTPLSLEEFARRIQEVEVGGLRLKIVRVDSHSVVVRYLAGNG